MSRVFLDRYSVVHAAVGAAFDVAGVSAPVAIASHVAFEAVEDGLKVATRSIWPDARPDGWKNHAGDVASFTAGYGAARCARRSDAGRVALVGLGTTAALIWIGSLIHEREWTPRKR